MILLFLGTLIISSCVSVQTLTSPENVVKTITVDSNHNSNYVKANEWMVNTFNDAESVIQFSDKEAGVVKGKYVMQAGQMATKYTPQVSPYYAMITLRVKEKGARIEVVPISKFIITKFMGANYGFTPAQFKERAKVLVTDFEVHMNNKSQNDNW